MATDNTKLLTLLLHLIEKAPYLSETDRDAEFDLLRGLEKELGAEGVIPPPAADANQPPAPPPDVDPGPVAEPVPASQQPAPIFGGGDAIQAPEAANAFSDVTPA